MLTRDTDPLPGVCIQLSTWIQITCITMLPPEPYRRLSYPINALFLRGRCNSFPVTVGHAVAGGNTA